MSKPTTSVNHTVSIRTAKNLTVHLLAANVVVMLLSSPGEGKTAILEELANDFSLHYINHVASTSEPTDVAGIPFVINNKAKLLTFEDIFPTEDMEIPEGKKGFLLNLDEFTSSEPDIQAAFYKVIHERRVGQKKLHPNLRITMTGNYLTDNAVVNPLSTAMWSRVTTLHVKSDTEEWIEDYALPNNFDPLLLGFIMQNNVLNDFDPSKHVDSAHCCPRTWTSLNKIIQATGGYSESMLPAYAGTISPGVAINLNSFMKISGNIVSIKEIIENPETARIEGSNNMRWATVASIIVNIEEENFIPLLKYALRMDVTMRILVYKAFVSKLPHLQADKEAIPLIAQMARKTL